MENGWRVNNIDATVNLERPKILKRVDEMKQVISQICAISHDAVSIKATTGEKWGLWAEKRAWKLRPLC